MIKVSHRRVGLVDGVISNYSTDHIILPGITNVVVQCLVITDVRPGNCRAVRRYAYATVSPIGVIRSVARLWHIVSPGVRVTVQNNDNIRTTEPAQMTG